MGELLGRQLQPRELAGHCYQHGWRDANLIRAVAVCLAESQGFDRAYNDNLDPTTGTVQSRDVGLFQINIPLDQIGTDTEEDLYDVEANVAAARALFERRQFQPWVAFNTGIAMRPDWWTWSTRLARWVPTGRYVHRAVRGVGNYMGETVFAVVSPAHMLLDYYRVPDKPATPPPTVGPDAAAVGMPLPLGERHHRAQTGEDTGV